MSSRESSANKLELTLTTVPSEGVDRLQGDCHPILHQMGPGGLTTQLAPYWEPPCEPGFLLPHCKLGTETFPAATPPP